MSMSAQMDFIMSEYEEIVLSSNVDFPGVKSWPFEIQVSYPWKGIHKRSKVKAPKSISQKLAAMHMQQAQARDRLFARIKGDKA